jgi:hypothetical protein
MEKHIVSDCIVNIHELICKIQPCFYLFNDTGLYKTYYQFRELFEFVSKHLVCIIPHEEIFGMVMYKLEECRLVDKKSPHWMKFQLLYFFYFLKFMNYQHTYEEQKTPQNHKEQHSQLSSILHT